MPRARTTQSPHRQTAAASTGSGCLSGFMLPPLAVLLFGILLTAFVYGQPAGAGPVEINYTPSSTESGLSPIFTPEVHFWGEKIIEWAAASGLDPNLAAVVMQIESCGDPRARSHAGAMGLFQVMPFHFLSTDSPYDPDTNALRGLAYLRRSFEAARGDPRLALAGYNGGIGVIGRAEWAWSAQTKRYVYYGAPIYSDAQQGNSSSAMLEEWHKKYGAGLCRQARSRLNLP
ncbi:MAG: lytic transglycosylase domain-containing protein [Chloroflexota bacterium]